MLIYRRKILFTLCIAMLMLVLPLTAWADTTPGKVESVTASVTAKKVTLSWSSVPGARGYYVYLQDAKTEDTFEVKVKKRTSATITGLEPGTTSTHGWKLSTVREKEKLRTASAAPPFPKPAERA